MCPYSHGIVHIGRSVLFYFGGACSDPTHDCYFRLCMSWYPPSSEPCNLGQNDDGLCIDEIR